MNPGSFEEMDKDFEKQFRPFRDQKMARKELKNFEAEVMKKIAAQSPHQQGIPFFGMAAAACVVLFFGAGIVWMQYNQPGMKAPALAPTAVIMKEAVPAEEPELMSEIEALKELGIWGEEDDKEIGITLENTLSDLELESNVDIPMVTEIKPVR